MAEVTGIFTDSETEKKQGETSPNTPEQQKIVDMVWSDYQVFKSRRQDIEETWRQEERFYEGGRRQWEALRTEATMKNRPNSVDNIAWSQIESIVSALTGWTPEGTFAATENGDEKKSRQLTKYMPYELRQIKFKQKYVKAVRRFVNHGLFLLETVYDPTVNGGRGNNRFIGQNDVIPLDYGCFFPDPRIGDLMYLQQSKAMILHRRKPIEYFAERWEKQGKKVQDDSYTEDVEIFEEDRQTSEKYFNTTSAAGIGGTEKQKTAGLIEYWYKGKPKLMSAEDKRIFREMADECLRNGLDPTECIAKAEGKADGVHCIYTSTSGVFLEHKSYVYNHGQYPVAARCLFTVEGTIWPKGYMRDLISPQIMLNKFSELAVEQTAKMGNGAVFYEEGSIAESKIPIWKRIRSTVGAMLPVLRLDGVKEIEGKGPPSMIMNFIQHWLQILQKIPRRFDSINGGANFQGESGRHAEALQAAAQGNLSTPTELIEDGLAEVFEQYIELVAQFYTQERIGRVLNEQVSIGKSAILSYAPTDYETGNLVPHKDTGEMVPEVLQLQEEYVPKFDISVSIGVEKPTDREYWVNLAFTLFKTIDPDTGRPMIDIKALQYTIENGRMEPFEVIEERMQKDLMMAQQMQQLQQENMMLGEQMARLSGEMQTMQQNDMKAQSDMMKTMREQDKFAHQQAMDQAKLGLEAEKIARQPVETGLR